MIEIIVLFLSPIWIAVIVTYIKAWNANNPTHQRYQRFKKRQDYWK